MADSMILQTEPILTVHNPTSGATLPMYSLKYPNGTLIQWGVNTLTASGTMSAAPISGLYWATFTLYLPVAFESIRFVIDGTTKYATGHMLPFGGEGSNVNSAALNVYDFYARPNNDGQRVFRWRAIGRWK